MKFDDVANQALRGEFLGRLIDEFLEWIIKENKLKKPSKEQIDKMKEKVLKEMEKEYPELKILMK